MVVGFYMRVTKGDVMPITKVWWWVLLGSSVLLLVTG